MSSMRGRGRIRAPRRAFTKVDVDQEETWDVLDKAFREIHARNASSLSFEELFRNAYRLVLKKQGDFLFEKIKRLEIDVLDNRVRVNIRNTASQALSLNNTTDSSSLERGSAGQKFMSDLTTAFTHHSTEASMITDVLMYMERVQSGEGKKISIYTVALGLFRERILQCPASDHLDWTVLELLEMVMLDFISRERSGEIIERPLIKASCRMLENLYETVVEQESAKLYLTSFEPKFLDASREYYRDEGRRLVEGADATTFCTRARQRLKEESERCYQSLSLTTAPKIKLVIEQELIEHNITDVINMPGTGVRNMVDNDKILDLQNLYTLVKQVNPRLTPLKDAVHKRILEIGREINTAANQIVAETSLKPKSEKREGEDKNKSKEKAVAPKQLSQQTLAAINWVEEVLKLKGKYDRLLVQAFDSDSFMEKALEISFQDFINENSRSAEFLSLFLDQYLKSSGKDKSEAEVDALLDSGVTLVQYLSDKDVLETYYHRHMSKRLLWSRSISRDVERQMLGKMKMRLGNQFTQKMEGLLKDVELSENLTQEYQAHIKSLGEGTTHKIDFEPSILTTTVWPVTIPEEAARSCILPADATRVKESFEKFYLNKHTGRKLTWLPNMGDVTIRATYPKDGRPNTCEVSGPTYFMVVLMLFNDHDRLSFDEILQLTNIPSEKLTQVLLSIAVAPKTRLLKKEPMSREINPTDIFSYNDKFEPAFRKFKVAVVSSQSNKLETTDQRKDTQKRADEERGLAIDAAIVRIMKARKLLSHQQLMTETIDILKVRFNPDIAMIKRKIESLIEREYLERDADAPVPSYKYLA